MKKYSIDIPSLSSETVIIAAGDYPETTLPLQILNNARYVQCCDGALATSIEHGIIPDAIVGDGDSMPARLREKYDDRITIISEQEDNDLTKNVKYAISRGSRHLTILAATGKREDHTLGNISLLMDYMHEADVKMITDYGVFFPCSGDAEFSAHRGQQVSIFNFGCTRLSASGLAYPLRPFTSLWQGTLNEMTADTFSIRADGHYLVYICTII
jgi:thiamine pyrophosphokinase